MGDRLDGRFNPAGAQPIACIKGGADIGPGEYYTINAHGDPVCRADAPFDLVTGS